MRTGIAAQYAEDIDRGSSITYLDPDIRDVDEVMKGTRTPPAELAKVLGLALKKSPRSTACDLFRRQVEDFFSSSGRRIWGKRYSPDKAIRAFHESTGIEN